MTGDEVAVILKAGHTLDERSGKVADLTEAGRHKCGDDAAGERDGGEAASESKVQPDARNGSGDRTADKTGKGLVGADLRHYVTLAEALAAEQCKGVAYPGRNAADGENGDPCVAGECGKAHDKYDREHGVCKHRKRCQSAGTSQLLLDYAGKGNSKDGKEEQSGEVDLVCLLKQNESADRNGVNIQHCGSGRNILRLNDPASFPN